MKQKIRDMQQLEITEISNLTWTDHALKRRQG